MRYTDKWCAKRGSRYIVELYSNIPHPAISNTITQNANKELHSLTVVRTPRRIPLYICLVLD